MLRSHRRPLRPGPVLALLLTVAGAWLAGCAKDPATAPAPVTSPAPAPDSPKNTLLALEWALEHKDLELARTLFTADFVFVFSPIDSAGNGFRDTPWTREDELICDLHMFVGGSATEPPADSIRLDFTNTLIEFPSSLPGRHATWHREIRAEVNLRVHRGGSMLACRGPGLFFFVRGDSAAIPQDLFDEGHRPDSTRWWIERWNDETLATVAPPATLRGPAPATPNSANTSSWGAIKALYR